MRCDVAVVAGVGDEDLEGLLAAGIAVLCLWRPCALCWNDATSETKGQRAAVDDELLPRDIGRRR